MNKQSEKSTDEDDEDDEFDPEGGGTAADRKWLAIACYYSGKPYSAKTLFSEMSKAWAIRETLEVRPLTQNRFVIEFDTEKVLKFVTNGGPWRFNSDALIVVPYDGFKRPLEIVIDKIGLWVQFHDVPIHLMTMAFTEKLARKISPDIIKAVGQVEDFLRVRLMFPLGDSLHNFVWQKVKGHGLLAFKVKYENVPNFCFLCGRIGHDETECPEEIVNRLEKPYGVWLRPSPLRKDAGKKIQMSPSYSNTKRALNFMGDQRDKALAAAATKTQSMRVPGEELDTQLRLGIRKERNNPVRYAQGGAPMVTGKEIKGATYELARGVEDMKVDDVAARLVENPLYEKGTGSETADAGEKKEELLTRERVSGLDSFLGSTEQSMASSLRGDDESAPPKGLRMAEKLLRAKNTKKGLGVDSKGCAKGGRHGKGSKTSPAKILGSLKDVQRLAKELGCGGSGGGTAMLMQATHREVAAQENLPKDSDTEATSPVKRSKVQKDVAPPLTGTQAGARQEQ